MSAVEDLLARFKALSASQQAAFLAAVPRPTPASTGAPALLTPSEHSPLRTAPSKKDRVTPMTFFKGDITAAVIDKALAQAKAKRKNAHVKVREDGAFQFPFVEIDQAGTHSRLFRVYPQKGLLLYVIEKKGQERPYNVRDLRKMKQVSSKEWTLRFGSKDGDHTRLHPIFPNASSAYQFGYLLRFMKDLVNPMINEGQEEPLSLFIGTWNVGNAPPIVDFSHWIPKGQYDIYVIGAQECEYEPREGFSSCEEDWRTSVSAHIGDKYTLLEHTSMWQIRMLVYVKKELRHNITNVGKSKEATGIGSVLGNKGGVAIGFDFGETSLCFVNSHLAAHQIMVQDRNEDVKEIIANLKLGPREDVSSDFQYVFWCGDLNYRIEGTKAGVEQLVREGKLDVLFTNDQLHAEMKKHTVFFGFSEGKLSFRPTYKFDRGTRDEYSQELGRVPSWCDRILSRCWPNSPLTLDKYTAAFDIMTSDHSPVSAAYSLQALRPFVPSSPHVMLIALYDLHGRHMVPHDANGYDDPYVKFHAPFLVRSRKTSTVHKTLNPNWVDEVVVLQTQVVDQRFLSKQHLRVVCWDRDVTTTNDLIGTAILSLKGVTDQPSEFHVKLNHRGLPRGELHGKILVIADPPPKVIDAFKAAEKSKSKK